MRREKGPIDGLDPKLVLTIYAVLLIPLMIFSTHPQVDHTLSMLGINSPANILGLLLFALYFWMVAIRLIEDPLERRKALGFLAFVHVLIVLVLTPRMRPAAMHDPHAFFVVMGLTAITITLIYTWLMANGDPRPGWNRVIDLFRPGTHMPSRRMTSGYEDRIRAAAAQEERNHLARELHDSIKQQVFAIHTAAATAEARLADDPQGTREAIMRVRESARDAMLEMEAMLDQMRTGSLTNSALVDAIRKQAEALRLRTGAEVVVEIDPMPAEHELPPSHRQAILRVAQESLNNVAKHARASRVTVALGVRGGEFVLTVGDDGVGYEQGRPTQGIGLAGMRARAAEALGEFSIESRPGRGTTVRFSVPVVSVPTGELGRMALFAAGGIALLLMFSVKIGYYALIGLPLPVLEFMRLSLAWFRARRLTKVSA
jgi:signal transduction histidine kinase